MRASTAAMLAALAVAGCHGSRDQQIADLQGPRAEQRAQAVARLAEQGNPDDLVLFTRAAKDLAPLVRAAAADALGKSQDLRVVDLLGELLEDPDEMVQGRAAMALAQIKGDRSKAYLTSQYGRRSRTTRLAIVQALKAANVPGAMAAVIAAEAQGLWERNLRALSEGSLAERVAAAEELGKSGRAEAVNRLMAAMRDSQVILAAGAVRGLGYAGDRRVAPEVAQLLTENFPTLREAACEALGRLQDPSALPAMEAVAVEKSATSPHATAAILALPALPETNRALCQIALDGDPDDALAAGHEMRRRGGCPLEPVLEQLAKQREPFAALTALQALGPAAAAAAPKLLPLLQSQNPLVRSAALQAAAELGDAHLAAPVKKLVEQEVAQVGALRAKWVSSLPEGWDLRGPSAEPNARDQLLHKVSTALEARAAQDGRVVARPRAPRELVDDATDDQLRLYAQALRALGRLEAEGAKPLLLTGVSDENGHVRRAALEGLVALGKEGIAAAAPGLLDPDRDVQAGVAEALAGRGEEGQRPIVDLLPKLVGTKLRMLDALRGAGAARQAQPALIAVVSEGGPEAALAAQLLGAMKSKEAVPSLLRYLEDPSAVGRREVVTALGEIGDAKAADEVAKDLNHDSPEVRAAAATAMASLGNATHLEALDALKGDYYRRVRESAEAALVRIGPQSPEPKK